jgi:hypothetical protein
VAVSRIRGTPIRATPYTTSLDVTHRNVPRSLPEYAQRAQACGAFLEDALRSAVFLRSFPWLLTEAVVYQPRTNQFEVTAQVAMGSHPDFDINRYRFADPVGTDMFYLLDTTTPIPLTPLIANRYCPVCMSMETCFVTHVEPAPGPATLRSFTRGHDLSDLPLADEVRELAAV